MNKTEKKKKFVSFVRSIEKSNKEFGKASQAKKIVMVAKDVLTLLALGRVKVQSGTYVHADLTDFKSPELEHGQLSDLLKDADMPSCNVCAIGGAMVATTMRLNKVPIGTVVCWEGLEGFFEEGEEDTMSARAEEVFSGELLRLMEDAFEVGGYGYNALKSYKGRLQAIYKNLVKNKGKKFTHYRNGKELWPKMAEGLEPVNFCG